MQFINGLVEIIFIAVASIFIARKINWLLKENKELLKTSRNLRNMQEIFSCAANLQCAKDLKELELPADRPIRRPYEQLNQAARALVG